MYTYDFHKNYALSLPKSSYIKKGLCGLANQGNTCFMNSVLQCLSNTLKLTDYFLSNRFKDDDPEQLNKRKMEYYLVMSYCNFLVNVWDTNQILRPKSFFENLAKFKPKYFKLQQQDSHECLMFILELLHKGLSYEITVDIKGTVENKTDELMKMSFTQFKNYYQKEYSYIIETFYGMFLNTINCSNCDQNDHVFEPYNCLQLELSESIQACLQRSFGTPETVSTWKCEKCKKTGCKKQTEIWTPPSCLIIHFKRFKNSGAKDDTHVQFPLDDLDLTPFVSPIKKDMNNYLYSCYAINFHSGDTQGGHYWSACKNMNGHWYMFNDSNVSKISDENVLYKNAYMLFYHRKMIVE
ncbi:ubiquitin carboxyl-terminal hydrolase [bacterium]|nr:ubiquitin carboxyl-terminal hydrolase [bacterium]